MRSPGCWCRCLLQAACMREPIRSQQLSNPHVPAMIMDLHGAPRRVLSREPGKKKRQLSMDELTAVQFNSSTGYRTYTRR